MGKNQLVRDRKGVLGIETATAFVLALLGLIVIGIAFVISIAALGDANFGSIDTKSFANTTLNETSTSMNETGFNLTVATQELTSLSCSSILVVNHTDNVFINSGNYSVDNCQITYSAGTGVFNNSLWNITYDFSYNTPSDSRNVRAQVVSNGTSGISTLFANTITWMTMLGVVITILIIVLLIVAIRRIEGAGTAVA